MDVIGTGSYPDEYTRTDYFSLPVPKIAAGVDLSFTVPIGVLWNVVSLTGKFTASAAVASRIPAFFIKDQAGSIVYQYNVATLTAAQTGTFTFTEDATAVPTFANGGNFLEPMPSTWLPSNWSFGTVTAAIDVADTWTNVNGWIQAYLPPEGE